jgi:hypothetical protein
MFYWIFHEEIDLQIPQLAYGDLTFFIAVASIVLLITTEFVSLHYGSLNLTINKKKIKNLSFVLTILFFIAFALTVLNIIGL